MSGKTRMQSFEHKTGRKLCATSLSNAQVLVAFRMAQPLAWSEKKSSKVSKTLQEFQCLQLESTGDHTVTM